MKRTQELSTRTRKPQKSVLYEEDSISEKYKPKGNNADITDWKKKQQQIELGVADPNSSELEACRSLIDSSKMIMKSLMSSTFLVIVFIIT